MKSGASQLITLTSREKSPRANLLAAPILSGAPRGRQGHCEMARLPGNMPGAAKSRAPWAVTIGGRSVMHLEGCVREARERDLDTFTAQRMPFGNAVNLVGGRP